MDITSIGNGGGNAASAALGAGKLDKDAFLHLLVTQLQHQDPLSPVSNEDFLAQLAQFTSVEQLESINSGTQTGLLMQQSLNNSLATALIGQEVLLDGGVLELSDGQSRTVNFELEQAGTVTVEIRDAAGVLVRSLPVEGGAQLEPGEHELAWDGLDDAGAALPDGLYQVSLSALDETGRSLALEPRLSGIVTGIRYAGGSAYLLVGGSEYTLSDVMEVRAPAPEEA